MKVLPQHRKRASVMIFAVLLLAAGVFVLAGIAQLAATQAVIGQNEWEALARRVRLENSRSLGRQYVLQHMFRNVIATNVSFTHASMGAFSLSPVTGTTSGDYWTTLSTTNTNVNIKINPFTLMERGGFYRVVIPGTISDGVTDVPWNFQVRTRSPITAGYPVVQQRPASNDITALVDPPYIDMYNAEQFVGFHEMARMRVSSVTNTNANDTNGYVGYLGVPIGVASWGPFTNAQAAPYGAGLTNLQMVIDLGADDPNDLNQVLVYEVPDRFDYIDTNAVPPTTNNLPVVAVKLSGTDIYGRKPLQVVVPASNTNVRSLLLGGFNSEQLGRPVYFNFQRTAGSGATLQVVTTNATGVWRIGITAAHCDIQFDGPITIVGGVRTDGRIIGNPTFEQELAPMGLDYIADRMMWLEDYKTP